MLKLLEDIPAPWYLKAVIWTARQCRKNEKLRNIIAVSRDRLILGSVMKLHLEAIHDIRKFCLGRNELPDCSLTYDALEHLANGCRDVMADILQVAKNDIHCTIKSCQGQNGEPKEQWQVYTIARSTPCERPADFGLSNAHAIGENSGFASVVGANDTKNTWIPHVYASFICNDLVNHSTYADSRENWSAFYRATAVFPLRYRMSGERLHNVIGFLTFDTMKEDLFKRIPCIFHLRNEKENYDKELSFFSFYHLGGIMADALVCAFYPIINYNNRKGAM